MNDIIYKVGKVSDMLGITTRTIRYYEEEGLLKPERTEKGTRIYKSADIERLRLVTQMTENGFSLEMVKAFLPVDQSRQQLSNGNIVDLISEKINKLTNLKDSVLNLS